MLSLAVTSSTSVVGVAVGLAGATPNAFNQVTTDRRHAEELTPLIAATLTQAGVAMGDIDQFVVDIGPGRFTGLRVGLATVRALALATRRPVISLTSLETLAGGEQDRPLLAVIDARRAEVFQQLFAAGDSRPEEGAVDEEAVVGKPHELAPERDDLVIVGDGADRYHEIYGCGVRLGRVPSAAVMLKISLSRSASPGPDANPLYLRDPDVNVNVKTRYGGRSV